MSPEKLLFNKILFLAYIADVIIDYGEQCGAKGLADLVDMNCGAVPQGEFEKVIDQSAPEPFLQMYVRTAEDRFAFAVTKLVSADAGFIEPIEQFCGKSGEANKAQKISCAKDALAFMDSYVLDGMPEQIERHFLQDTSALLQWENSTDSHAASWKKAGGDVSLYYRLLTAFVNGLLTDSGFVFSVEGNSRFSIKSLSQ